MAVKESKFKALLEQVHKEIQEISLLSSQKLRRLEELEDLIEDERQKHAMETIKEREVEINSSEVWS
jgi:hypothetical protein